MNTRSNSVIGFSQLWWFTDVAKEMIAQPRDTLETGLEVANKELNDLTKCKSPWPYYSVYTIFLFYLTSIYFGGYFYFIIPVFALLFLPIVELFAGNEIVNPLDQDYDKLQDDVRYKWAAWLWIVPQLLVLLSGTYISNNWGLTGLEKLGLILSTGIVTGGIGINVAHELIHRNNGMEKTLGQILLLSDLYGHFYIEHILGHHANLCNEGDAGTSFRNEPVYHYIPRSISTAYRHGWELAIKYKRVHVMWIYHGIQFMYLWYAYSVGGFMGVCYIILQSLVAIIILETVNYFEHYGLHRENGQSITKYHAWNTDKIISNYFTFRLQRHSDHHMNSRRRYPNLRNIPGSPQLPTGYTGCIILAWIPPLWYYIMNPRLNDITYGKKSC